MVVASIICSLMLVAGWYFSSYSSVFYIFAGVYMRMRQILNRDVSHVFSFLFFYSLIALAGKFMVLYFWWNDFSKNFFDFTLEIHEIEAKSWEYYFPDIIIGILSVIGRFSNSHMKRFRTAIIAISMTVLCLTGISMMSISNLLYLLFFVLYFIGLIFEVQTIKRLIPLLISLLSTAQLVYPFFTRYFTTPFNVLQMYKLGLLDFKTWSLIQILELTLLVLCNCSFSFIFANYHKSYNAELTEPFSPNFSEKYSQFSYLETVLNIKYIFTYTLACVMLWLWIILYKGPAGVIIMSWIFISILNTSHKFLKCLTVYILIPTLLLSFIMNFCSSVFSIENSTVPYAMYHLNIPIIETVFALSTIMVVATTVYYSKDVSSFLYFPGVWYGRILANLFKRIYLVSLIVLFLIGLSDINLLHSGLMVLCLFFMTNPESIKRFWVWLLGYIMAMLYIRYVYFIVQPYLGEILDENHLGWFGLKEVSDETQFSWIPYDYLIWILFVSVSLQHQANLINVKEENQSKKNFVFKTLHLILDYISRIEIYVLYTILLIIVFISKPNFLNGFRLIIICAVFLKHFHNSTNLSINFKETYALLVLLEAYSALLLASRYFYQFQIYIPLKVDFPLTGYEVYDEKQKWYTDTSSDWAIFILSVLATRNCKERSSISLRGSLKIRISDFFTFFSQPFQYFFFLVIYSFAIYSKLGVSMLIFVMLIGFYSMYIAFYFMMFSRRELHRNIMHEWGVRCFLFKCLFFCTLLCTVVGYGRFLLFKENALIEEWFGVLDWGLFVLGFTKRSEESLLIVENYPYLVILLACMLERNCLEELKLHYRVSQNDMKLKLTSINSIGDEIDYLKKKLGNCKVKVFLKSIAESLIPMFLMLLAFDKISIISVVYIAVVFFSSCSPDLTISGLLFTTLIFMVDVQYTLILSNISAVTAGFVPESQKPLQIPWFDHKNWPNSDQAKFFNMGTSIFQLENLIYDMVALIGVLMYYNYLSGSEREKEDLIKKLQEKTMAKSTESEENEEDKNLIKIVLEQIKHYFYIFSRLLVTAILLLFVTQGQGLVSMPYIVFCMIFIYKEISQMKSDKFSSYTDLLSWFLKYIIIDLTSQILIQIPFLILEDIQLSKIFFLMETGEVDTKSLTVFTNEFLKWCNYIGLMKIWKASDTDLVKSYLTILSKVYSFTFLFMIYRMMKSKDYNIFNQERFKSIESKAQVISVKMAQNFNDERIKKNKFYAGSKERFHKELQKLEDKLKKLNKKNTNKDTANYGLMHSKSLIKDLEEHEYIDFSRKVSIGEQIKQPSGKIEYSFTSRMLDNVVAGINVYLFDDFIDKITPFGRMSAEKNNLGYVEKTKKKKKYYKSFVPNKDQDESDSDSEEEVNLDESYEKEVIEYEFVWNHYPKLIMYFLASQTEAIVYCSFFINHFKYASLESVIFPLSVIGYALLEYPRPRPRYFQIMMVYAQFVIVLKFFLKIELIIELIGTTRMAHYKDPLKIGFNDYKNTYSETMFNYILWDVVVIISLLLHQQYLYRVGLQNQTEKDIETLHQAKIRNKIKQIEATDDQTHFFSNLLIQSKEEKPGKDWYTHTILIQIITLVYIFVFFSKLDGNSINIEQSFRNNQFQGRMVSAVMVQMVLIIADRYFYIKQTTDAFMSTIPNKVAIYFRVVVHLVLTLVIHVLCFWYFPINGNHNTMGSAQCENMYDLKRCNNFEINVYLEYFYLLQLAYLIFSALQIKHGMPSFKRSAFPLTRIVSPISLALFKTYRGAPFFFELRTLIDWVSTNTALTIFQWFKFEDINSQLFINKCTQRSLETKKTGAPIEMLEKCYMGVVSIVIIFIIILAPLMVFSTMNPIVENNSVQSMNLQVSLVINNREFSLFKSNTADRIQNNITKEEWGEYNFSQIKELVATDQDIMQVVDMPSDSDFTWNISPPSKKKLCAMLNNQNSTFAISTLYKFKRNFPESRRTVELQTQTNILNITLITEFRAVICDESGDSLIIPKVFYQLIRLPSNVNSINPTVIKEDNFITPLILTFNEQDQYWRAESMNSQNQTVGVKIFTLSDKFSKITLNYSVNSMFVSVVLAIGLTIKLMSRGSAYYLGFSDMKRTDYLETLCAGVYVSRMIGDIEKEEELYYELIDILRSTETTKMITGNQSIKKVKSD